MDAIRQCSIQVSASCACVLLIPYARTAASSAGIRGGLRKVLLVQALQRCALLQPSQRVLLGSLPMHLPCTAPSALCKWPKGYATAPVRVCFITARQDRVQIAYLGLPDCAYWNVTVVDWGDPPATAAFSLADAPLPRLCSGSTALGRGVPGLLQFLWDLLMPGLPTSSSHEGSHEKPKALLSSAESFQAERQKQCRVTG